MAVIFFPTWCCTWLMPFIDLKVAILFLNTLLVSVSVSPHKQNEQPSHLLSFLYILVLVPPCFYSWCGSDLGVCVWGNLKKNICMLTCY